MTNFDYPPTRTFALGEALADAKEEQQSREARVNELEADDDATDRELAKARKNESNAESRVEALDWAVNGDGRDDGFDGWGADATLSIQAFTAKGRARILDTLNRTTMGPVGSQQTRNWLIAGSIQDAPWLSTDDGLQDQASTTGELPPGILDWIDDQLTGLNELTEGN